MRGVVVFLLVACQAGVAAGSGQGSAAAQLDVTAKEYPMPPLPRARVVLSDAFGGKHRVEVEVAATREARTRGMMWRTEVGDGKGMLFIFPAEEELTFWMKNTLIPLDMIFVARDRTIVGIVERAEPRSLMSRGPGKPAMYVVELAGGVAARMGLKPGLKVELEGVQAIVASP